jgi:hypothetical protein
MYLIAACLPLLRPIFAKHSPAWLKNISVSFTSRNKSGNYPIELTSHSGARSGFTRLNTPYGTINNDITKSEIGEGSMESAYKDGIRSESEGWPLQGIEVTKEVRIQHSEKREEAGV